RLDSFITDGTRVARLTDTHRCPPALMRAGWALALGTPPRPADSDAQEPPAHTAAGENIQFWRAANERAQAQAVAAEIERLISREGVDPGAVAVLVPEISREGQAASVALEERAVPHRLI